jgi:hypothetical protein
MWLLFALGAIVGCGVCGGIASVAGDNDHGFIMFVFGIVAVAAGLAGLGCFAVGVILFVKWVWAS